MRKVSLPPLIVMHATANNNNIGSFKGELGDRGPPVEKKVVENLDEMLKHVLVLLNQVFLVCKH